MSYTFDTLADHIGKSGRRRSRPQSWTAYVYQGAVVARKITGCSSKRQAVEMAREAISGMAQRNA